MEIKKIFLVLVDISGYTRFIKLHKLSLMHAEHIIDQLLETVIKEATFPLVLHELEGDAVTFYAESDGSREMAQDIYAQVERFFKAFWKKEGELVSDCSLCVCDACAKVRQLKLKAILHHGEAVFTTIRQFNKMAGEDVILAHRLLKNSIESSEYLLLTEAFHAIAGDLGAQAPERRSEYCEGLGPVNIVVYYPQHGTLEREWTGRPFRYKVKMAMELQGYVLHRLLKASSKQYRNLERPPRS